MSAILQGKDTEINVVNWLREAGLAFPDNIAIDDLGCTPLNYIEFWQLIDTLSNTLQKLGIGKGDVVLVALPNGPAALISLLAVMRTGIAFPITAFEQVEEYERIIGAAKICAVLTHDRPHAALTGLAKSLSLPHFTLVQPEKGDLTSLKILGKRQPSASGRSSLGEPSDAMWVRTSGTTATPKIVAVSHQGVLSAIVSTSKWLELSSADRSLCVTPFQHVHAIYRSTLPVLAVGGTLLTTPGFSERHIYDWIEQKRPTYLTAVPSMHRKLLQYLSTSTKMNALESLRILATGSEALPDNLHQEMLEVFNTPVAQFYGQSETTPFLAISATQHSSQSGIGRAAAPWRLSIVDKKGSVLQAGQMGEVVAKGGIVNHIIRDGKRHEPATTHTGWLRTGDLGSIDVEGNLSLYGRIVETIDKAGVKIEPMTVENAIISGPFAHAATVFGVAGANGTTRIIALVVRANNSSRQDLITDLAKRIARHMMPDEIIGVTTIPTTQAGKVSRIQLANQYLEGQFGDLEETVQQALEDQTDNSVFDIVKSAFCEVLDRDEIDPDVGFFESGGDSFSALRLIVDLEGTLERTVSPVEFANNSSARALSSLLQSEPATNVSDEIIEVGETQAGKELFPPIFLAPSIRGHLGYSRSIFKAFGDRQPVYTFDLKPNAETGKHSTNLPDIAAHCVHLLQTIQPTGPYRLIGHSFGGQVAFRMANILVENGECIDLLGIIDDEADLHKREFNAKSGQSRDTLFQANHQALRSNIHQFYPGKVTLFRGQHWFGTRKPGPAMDWEYLALGGVDVYNTPASHRSIVRGNIPNIWVEILMDLFQEQRGVSSELDPAAPLKFVHVSSRVNEVPAELMLARTAAMKGNLSKEIGNYRKAHRSNKQMPDWARLNFAQAELQNGSFGSFVNILLSGLASSNDRLPILISLNRELTPRIEPITTKSLAKPGDLIAQLWTRQLQGRILRELKSHVCETSFEYNQLAHYFRTTGELDEEIRCLKTALNLDDFPQYRINLSRALLKNGQQEASMSALKGNSGKFVNDPKIMISVGQNLLARGDLNAAETTFKGTLKNLPMTKKSLVSLASIYQSRGEFALAHSHLSRAAQLNARPEKFQKRLNMLKRKLESNA